MLLALAIALTVAGGVLPIVGILTAWARTRRTLRALDADLTEIDRLSAAGADTAAINAVRPSTTTWTHASYQHEHTERAILTSARDDLRGPAILAGIGALCGMAGSLLSLGL